MNITPTKSKTSHPKPAAECLQTITADISPNLYARALNKGGIEKKSH
jgi:hypothetical protein